MRVASITKENVCYFILGIGILMPWNAFITAADYYEQVFPGKHVDRLATVFYLPSNLLALASFIFFFSSRCATLRVTIGFCLFGISMFLVSILDAFNLQSLPALLTFIAVCGAADGAAQGALFGHAAVSGDSMNVQAIIAGTSMSGVIVSILRIVTKATFVQGGQMSSNIYFILSGIVCICCAYIFSIVLPSLQKVSPDREIHFRAPGESETGHSVEVTHEGDQLSGKHDSEGETAAILGPKLYHNDHEKAWDIVRQCKEPMLALIGCYLVTLSIFPGVLAEDLATSSTWYPVMLISAFNVADCIGKMCPVAIQEDFFSRTKVIMAASARLAFIPLFLVSVHSQMSILLVSILTIFLGLTNGALTTITMMFAPSLITDEEEVELCGNLTVLCLIFGLNVGAFSGFLWLL
jgi:equilibrative nucleoside transporter 1/2/3